MMRSTRESRAPAAKVCLLLSLLLLLCPAALVAEEAAQEAAQNKAPDKKGAVPETGVLSLGTEAGSREAFEAGFTPFLIEALRTAFREQGLDLLEAEPPDTSAEKAAETAVEKAASSDLPWRVQVHCQLRERRLFWTIAVYRGGDGALLASDAFSSFAGLSVRPLLTASAQKLAVRWLTAQALAVAATPTDLSLTFESSMEGAEVWLGKKAEGGLLLGTIEKGKLDAAYLPIFPGRNLVFEEVLEGYWSKQITVKGGVPAKRIALPSLQRKTTQALLLLSSPNRFQGLTVSWRYHLKPDALYLRTDLSPWFQYDYQPGSSPLFHLEALAGGAMYLPFFAHDARFRISTGLSVSLLTTTFSRTENLDKSSALDLMLSPCELSFEYHFPRWALILDLRPLYSLGLTGGLLPRGWVESQAMGPMSLFAGGMYKW